MIEPRNPTEVILWLAARARADGRSTDEMALFQAAREQAIHDRLRVIVVYSKRQKGGRRAA